MNSQFIFPKPRDWEAFEDIVCDLLRRRYANPNLQRYGRRGQKQQGVDIVGLTYDGITGIQCKHHPQGSISTKEIDEEVAKAEKFQPALDNLIIATSAERDSKALSHVLKTARDRQEQGRFTVSISFWKDVYDELTQYPDLLYKHFTQYFPPERLENIHIAQVSPLERATALWPVDIEKLKENALQSLRGVEKSNPYRLVLGVSTFPHVTFTDSVDLQVQLDSLYEREDETDFSEAQEILQDIRNTITDSFFSRELYVHQQVRLSLAFLFGSVFRRVTGFDLFLYGREGIWATKGLPLVPSSLSDDLPVLMNEESKEIVIVLNISRNIGDSVAQFVSSWPVLPRAIVGLSLADGHVRSASHAFTLSLEISRKLKNFADSWGMQKIHLFAAMPAALATLTTYHLNAICPLVLYYRDETRTKYLVAGTIEK